jgi:hypothetical protein
MIPIPLTDRLVQASAGAQSQAEYGWSADRLRLASRMAGSTKTGKLQEAAEGRNGLLRANAASSEAWVYNWSKHEHLIVPSW